MQRVVQLLLIAYCLLLPAAAQPRDFTRWVNPFIGTGGHGHTFPGATLPFGMVQLSPDTRIDNWDGSSGYHYSDDIIYGFSHTHLSGTGIPDGCDILFMPAISEYDGPKTPEGNSFGLYTSRFLHSDEVAQPGYYSVKLDDRKIVAELTATSRVGFHRYTFPESRMAGVNLNLHWRDRLLDGEFKVVDKKRVEGYRRSSSWAKNQTVYFVAEFSRSFDEIALGSTGDKIRSAFFSFSPKAGDQILLKVAISSVSIEGARKNLEAELPGWDFDRVRTDAKAAWNKELSKIEVSGGTLDQTTTFYTALYHTMIHPNVFNDVDGRYKGHDGKIHSLRRGEGETRRRGESLRHGEGETRRRGDPVANESPRPRVSPSPRRESPTSSNGDQYTVFSLWDTFRAAHPLYTIIDQKRTVDFINTFIRIYEQGGRLPVWELWGEETDTMIGYHAVSVIADAMAKGIQGFDYEKAFEAAKHSAELDHFGLAAYKRRGYISSEDENESVSKTLEYAYDDWCIERMAMTMINAEARRPASQRSRAKMEVYSKDFKEFQRRRSSFANIFDSRSGFARPKRNGGFIEPFAPNEVTFGFTEGNSWQYSFFVPHDVEYLEQLLGGRYRFRKKLDELFTTSERLAGREQPDITGLIGQYAHGNEPSHHIAYLYNHAGESWKTQKYVRKIMDEFYKPTPDGLIGNEDCGQMSAWYVLSAAGLYQIAPGLPIYDIGTPLFKEIKFNLENGKTFLVQAPNVSNRSFYVRSVKLNGSPAQQVWHGDIMKGGSLVFDLSADPVPTTVLSVGLPTAAGTYMPVPVIEGVRNFKDKTTVVISANPGARITYMIDNYGEEFARKTRDYTGPFTIDDTSKVEAYTSDTKTGRVSMNVEAEFRKRLNSWTVKLISPYSTQYTGGGDDALVDGIRGTANFASGEWQGYQGKTFEAVIDLQRETEIKSVGGSFLQVTRSWIWMPDRIEFEVSDDGANFTKIAEIKPGFPQQEMDAVAKEFRQSVRLTRARYVRVRAFNFGKIPSWHPGAGGDPWIFVDEIFID